MYCVYFELILKTKYNFGSGALSGLMLVLGLLKIILGGFFLFLAPAKFFQKKIAVLVF